MERWTVSDRLDTTLDELSHVQVRMVAGEVAVTAVAEGPARLEVVREEGPEVNVELRDGKLRVRHGDEGSSAIETLLGFLRGRGRVSASVTLQVPPGTTVDVGAVSAGVLVSGVRGRTDVKVVSGDVTLDAIGSHLDVKTVSGDVQARGIDADFKAKTVSGGVTLVDGSSRWVEAKTVSGDVLLDLHVDPSAHYDLATVSGSVSVRTRGEPSLVVEAASVSGNVVSDFDIAWQDNRPGRRRLRSVVGDGQARLSVKTVSGALRIVRSRDAVA